MNNLSLTLRPMRPRSLNLGDGRRASGRRLRAIRFTLALCLLVLGAALLRPAWAGVVRDPHGNEGYDTAAECDAAVLAGTARFYHSYTFKPAQRHPGEAAVRVTRLADIEIPATLAQQRGFATRSYAYGACDRGVGRRVGRDGVAPQLSGKFVPYSPDMPVNVYIDRSGQVLRISMKQCDNRFDGNFPRPVPAPASHAMLAPPTQVFGVPQVLYVPPPVYYYYPAPAVVYGTPIWYGGGYYGGYYGGRGRGGRYGHR